jgi:drug/metabolite transporter (DMT)-like permease
MPPTVYALALAGAVCNAGATILIRRGLRDASPYTGVWINLVVGTIALWPAVALTDSLQAVGVKGLAYFAAAGIVGTLAGRLFRFVAIEKVGAAVSSAVINLNPFISSGLAVLLLGERVTVAILAGTVVIVLGTMLLSTTGREVGFRPFDLVIPFLSASCFGVVAILRKLGLSQTGPVLGFAVNVTTGLIVFTLFLLLSGSRRTMVCRGRSLVHFLAAGLAENAGVFMTLVALKLGTVSVVAPISAAAPIFVLPLSVVFLRGIERLTARVVIATLLVVSGVYLIVAPP